MKKRSEIEWKVSNNEQFEPRYISTIGVDYGVKQLSLFNREVKVHFWDLSGHPDFVEVRNEFYRDTHAVKPTII